jgi:hypothetical protein
MAMTTPSRRSATAAAFLTLALAATGILAVNTSTGQAIPPSARTTATPRLIDIQAAHHPGFDRVVFRFDGGLPSRRSVGYVNRLTGDPSGAPIPIAGRAILRVVFSPAAAHDDAGNVTTPSRFAFALPNVMSVVRSGDFEAVLSHGIGLAQGSSFHMFTLTGPSRVVIDISTPFRTVLKGVYFFNEPRFAVGKEPFVTSVLRPVLPGTPATGVMDRLFAGPTASEYASGLRLLQSKATGFAGLSIGGGVARVRLTGGCSSGGSTASIANEIFPTLKQFTTVGFVKIYDPAGHTETPSGRSDSIPFCLEP